MRTGLLQGSAIAITMLASLHAPIASAFDNAWLQRQNESMAALQRDLAKGDRLAKDCGAAWIKSWSSACKQFDRHMEEQQRKNAAMGAYISSMEAMNYSSQTSNSIARSQRSLQDRNARSQARQDANTYSTYANQSRRNGDSYAAQRWQSRADDKFREANGR